MMAGTLQQLLAMPAPTPRTTSSPDANEARRERPQQFYDKENPPPDDASVEDLLDYWERWASTNRDQNSLPSATVRQRLLAACEAEPEKLPGLLPLLPVTPEAAARVKKLYDAEQNAGQPKEGWLKPVREWLKVNSRYFLDELLAEARRAKDDQEHGDVDNVEALGALARVDWPGAEPLLQTFANGSQSRVAALALSLLYRHAIEEKDASAEEKYRASLQAIASDRIAPARARDTAIEILSLTDWSGRDEWYLSLFTDETLLAPGDGIYGFHPLTTLFDRDPDKWIPVMTRLVESKNRAVQQSAASCLVRYVNFHPRRDAILPVLRWLSDPDWLDLNGTDRAWFMQKMDELEMPESVPGLIWIVENEEANANWAARTLAHYKDPRAIPALKKALAAETYEGNRVYFIEGLLASGGITEEEQISALEAYAGKLTTSEGRAEVERYRSYGDELLPLPVSIGKYLAGKPNAPDSLITAALERVKDLQQKNPALSRALLQITQGWQTRRVDLDMLQRIATGTADATTISNALERRATLVKNLSAELQSLLSAGGAAQGIAAVLTEDEALAQNILGAQDRAAQMALLACARLVQMPLNTAQVGPLLDSKIQPLMMAAERYLLAEDSKEARQLLWARHKDEAFITGWRENLRFIGGGNFDAMGKVEEKLRAELFQEDAPLEIFTLLYNQERPHHVLRVYRTRAVYTYYEDAARYQERVITGEELARFKSFVANNNITELGPQIGYCHYDCAAQEFLQLTRPGGRRVFAYQSIHAWVILEANFEMLGHGDGLKLHYYLEREIKGLELLYAGRELAIQDVWKQGKDLRVLVQQVETEEEAEQRQAALNAVNDDEEDVAAAREAARRQQIVRSRERVSWRAFTQGKPGAVSTPPEGYSTFDEDRFEIERDIFPPYLNSHLTQAVTGGSVVLARDFTEDGGLWIKAPGQKAVRIGGEGAYADPLVTPDGKWAVAAMTDSNWGRPNYVVRFNLQTGREYRVNIPPAQQFRPIAFLAAHGRVLLRRARDEDSNAGKADGPDAPEFYLLDAATGRTQLLTGVFAPLEQEGKRFLQPTGNPYEYWAAIPERAANQTRVGRYNIKDFSFRALLVVPHITFDSMSMWVDETDSQLYVVYEGQLLRLPFPLKD